jgi:hypothetical protein
MHIGDWGWVHALSSQQRGVDKLRCEISTVASDTVRHRPVGMFFNNLRQAEICEAASAIFVDQDVCLRVIINVGVRFDKVGTHASKVAVRDRGAPGMEV